MDAASNSPGRGVASIGLFVTAVLFTTAMSEAVGQPLTAWERARMGGRFELAPSSEYTFDDQTPNWQPGCQYQFGVVVTRNVYPGYTPPHYVLVELIPNDGPPIGMLANENLSQGTTAYYYANAALDECLSSVNYYYRVTTYTNTGKRKDVVIQRPDGGSLTIRVPDPVEKTIVSPSYKRHVLLVEKPPYLGVSLDPRSSPAFTLARSYIGQRMCDLDFFPSAVENNHLVLYAYYDHTITTASPGSDARIVLQSFSPPGVKIFIDSILVDTRHSPAYLALREPPVLPYELGKCGRTVGFTIASDDTRWLQLSWENEIVTIKGRLVGESIEPFVVDLIFWLHLPSQQG